MFKLTLRVKKAYGKVFFYPESEDAHLLCKIVGKGTLTKDQVKILDGDERFEIVLLNETLKLEDL